MYHTGPMSDAVFREVGRMGGFEELELSANGLRVLLAPEASLPVVAVCIVYRVGSRNEATGHTGATHLLEHLLFKGSRGFDPAAGRSVARVLERVGAAFNATTWFDRTTYYETLPAEHLELALALEADRMRNALLRAEDLESETRVVLNELERGENDPFEVLLRESFATAFREHPYHHPTIGWRSDVEAASVARLRAFYDTFYVPNNATLVLVGGFERAEALRLIAAHFGPLVAGGAVPSVVTRESAQEGERRFVVRRAGEVGWVLASWRAPQASHPDTHALAVLADALAGGITSRLHQRLVDGGLCLDAQAIAWQLRDPGSFQIAATLDPRASHASVEGIIREEAAALAAAGLSEEELERAKVQVEAHTAYHRDSPGQVAATVAEAVAVDDWRGYVEYPHRIRAVTAAETRRVACETFHDDALTLGWFVPERAGAASARLRGRRPGACEWRGGLAAEVTDAELGGGARIVVLPRRTNPTVHLAGSLLAGHGMTTPDRWTAASLLPDMLERGTRRLSRLELARLLEDRGIELAVSGESFNPTELIVAGRCLSRHVGILLDTMAEMLRFPSLPATELRRLRTLRLGELAHSREDTFLRAFEAFLRLVYPEGHPHCPRSFDERRRGLEEVRKAALVGVHRELMAPAGMALVLVGDVDPDAVIAMTRAAFAGWDAAGAKPPELARRAPTAATPAEVREAMADKPNLDVVLGHPGGLRRRDPDFVPALLGNAVLGQSTLSSRLGRRLRDQLGVTYGVVSRFFGAALIDGPWAATFSVGAADVDRAVAAAREEIGRLWHEGPSDGELDDERQAFAGSYRVSLATSAGLARELLRLARHGLPFSELDALPARILATTRAEVTEAIRAHIAPDSLSLAVAGDLGSEAGAAAGTV